MEMMQWVHAIKMALKSLETATERFCVALQQETGFAFYWKDGEETFGDKALEAAEEHIRQWQYPPKKAEALGAIACNPATLALAEELNEQKALWDILHQKIRREACGLSDDDDRPVIDSIATPVIRRALSLAGYGKLNLDATDRKVPVLRNHPIAISWYRNNSTPSSRKSMNDVLNDLHSLMDLEDSTIAARVEAEITRLSSVDKNLPVAYRAKSPVYSLGFEATFIRYAQEQTVKGYGANPICFLASSVNPKLSVLKRKNAAGAGRPRSISEERVSLLLPHYFWYLKQPKKKVAEPKRRHNPYASTAFRGLWLGVRKGRDKLKVQVMVAREGKSTTSVSIDRLGLAAAWQKAAELYCEGRAIPLAAVVDAQPPESQVAQLLQWAEEHAD